MSLLFVVVIGAVAGWVGGQYIKGSEMGIMPDIIAGAAGGFMAALLGRFMGLDGVMVSIVMTLVGAIGVLFAMRRVLKEKPVPVARPRRR